MFSIGSITPRITPPTLPDITSLGGSGGVGGVGGPDVSALSDILKSYLSDSFSGSGAAATDMPSGAGALPSPTSRLSGLASQPSGHGPGFNNLADMFSAVSGAGASGGAGGLSAPSGAGGLGAPSGAGAGGLGVPSGGGNLADAAKAENMQHLDDKQKANLAMQEAAQKQSEAAALMSTIMKMLHDSIMQIIQNMK